MSGFGDYDAWKCTDPAEYDEHVCERCGDYMRHDWHSGGWFCRMCDQEREYLEREFDEQGDKNEGA
jgi:ribosomal protein L37AE/L43A